MNLSKKTILFLIFAFYFSNTIIASDATDHIRKKVRTNNNAPAIKTSSQSLLSLLQHQDIGPEILEYVGDNTIIDRIIHETQEEVAEAVRTVDWVTLRKASNLLNVLGCKNYIKNWRNLENNTLLYFVSSNRIFNNPTYQSIYNSKQTKTMQELLNHGIDVNVQNNNRETFMYCLVRDQNLRLIKKLKKDYAVRMNNGKNLIHTAIRFNKSGPSSDVTPEFIDLIETLVFFGEDINNKEKIFSHETLQTPYQRYEKINNGSLGKLLKDLGAK